MNDAILPTLDQIVEDRLEELLFGGHITQMQYQEAILGHQLPIKSLTGYLHACWNAPCDER